LKNNELHFKVMQALCDRIIVFIWNTFVWYVVLRKLMKFDFIFM
jgi:hypothetical protein